MFRETPESPRMFESDVVDFFSRVHWATVPALYVPVSAFCAWRSWATGVSGWGVAGLFALGFFLWTLAEYGLHRSLFHWRPAAAWGERFHFILHGIHHDFPMDRLRLVMPPAASLFLLFFVFGPLFVFGFGATGWALLSGFVVGYINYDLTHYYLHHAKPKSARMKKLRAHHMSHHFAGLERKYGVSFMLWDHVFGTMEDRNQARKPHAPRG